LLALTIWSGYVLCFNKTQKSYIVPNYNIRYMTKPQKSNLKSDLFIESARQRIAEVLFKHPDKEFSLSDLAIEAKVKKSNIGRILNAYQEIGFIHIEKLSKIWRIKANQSSKIYLNNKVAYNLHSILSRKLTDFIRDKYNNPKSIILFGSYRNGDDISTSDIDIAVESDDLNEYKIINLKELASHEAALGRKIQLHLFNRRNIDVNLFNNIANGIVLWGFLEVRP